MKPPNIEDLACQVVPGAGAVSVRCLGTGLFNTTYQVIRDALPYALRVPADCAANWQDRGWEIRVLQQASRVGLAPPLLYAEAQSGVLLRSWVVGDSWSEAAAGSSEALERLARLLLAVHALPIPQPAYRMDAAAWVERYTGALLPEGASAVTEFAGAAAGAMQMLQTLPQPTRPVVCHSDLHRLNLLQRNGGALLLLDWEYSHVADPYWDLAGWSANNDLPEQSQRDLLAIYGGAQASAPQWLRFRLHYWLYDYICLLWIELNARLRPVASANFASRRAWLESRLRVSVYGTIIG